MAKYRFGLIANFTVALVYALSVVPLQLFGSEDEVSGFVLLGISMK